MVYWLRMFFTIHVSCFWGIFHPWDCSCEHSLGCTRTFERGGCPSMHQSGLSLPFVFVCLFYDLLSFLFHCRFAFEINIGLDERSFVCASRFPRACVSERQISRVFWTIRNSRFPKFADQNHIRSSYSFFPGSHLWVSRTPQILRVTWRILSHRHAVPRDETTCACFHLQRELSEELTWDLFIGTNSCAKL